MDSKEDVNFIEVRVRFLQYFSKLSIELIDDNLGPFLSLGSLTRILILLLAGLWKQNFMAILSFYIEFLRAIFCFNEGFTN